MNLFPRAFLLVFGQLSVGGFLSLSIPPFHQIQRGYYKSSAFVYLLLGTLALIGRLTLWIGAGVPTSGTDLPEICLWSTFALCGSGYFATLWGERFALRARLFTATWASGLAALVVAAESYAAAPILSVESVLYPATFLLSALLLGSAASGMLLGHWYLIDRDLPLSPLWTILRFYLACLGIQIAVFAIGLLALSLLGTPASSTEVGTLFPIHAALIGARVLVSPLGAAILGAMIWRTLQIPQTMAATGLFYIAVLAVLVGEFMGRYLLFRTGLPL